LVDHDSLTQLASTLRERGTLYALALLVISINLSSSEAGASSTLKLGLALVCTRDVHL
jgi:hypothetical protein